VKFGVEFFPPAEEMLNEVCGVVKTYVKNYPVKHISITHGAAGGKKDKSLVFIESILEKGIIPAKNITAHLSCAGLTKGGVQDYVSKFYALGIREILVIKGDPTATTVEDGYATTSDAIVDIKKHFPDIKTVAACFPEPRQGVSDEIAMLKEKITSGAERFISQFCFENHFFESFYQDISTHKITNEMTIGLIIPSPQTLSFAQKCYANIPNHLHEIAKNERKAIQFVVNQLKFIEEVGFNSVHLYSLNKLGFTQVLDEYLK
jgi:methylenetetrahydrofolate reductase (NADPH)